MTAAGKVVIIGPGQGTEHRVGRDRFLTKGDGGQRSESFSVVEYEAAPGLPGPPLHVHRGCEEAWFILDGEVEFSTADQAIIASRGTYLFVPRGEAHSFHVLGNRPARWIGIFSPGRYVGLVEQLGTLIPERGPPDLRALAVLFARYDSEIVATPD